MMVLKYIKFIRAIFILLTSFLLMHVILFLGFATNITGIYPKDPSPKDIINAKNSIKLLIIVISILTVGYQIIEDIYKRRTRRFPTALVVYDISQKNRLILSYVYFFFFSFLNFLIVIHFISKDIGLIIISNTLLNIIPIYFINKLMIQKADDKKGWSKFWIITLIMSVILVIPYGTIIFDLFIHYATACSTEIILFITRRIAIAARYLR
jgi:hypothetical protein